MLVALAMIVTVGVKLLEEIVRMLLIANAFVTQVSVEVISTVTISPSLSVLLLKVGLLLPTFVPFTFHWYDGLVPPLVGVAVNVTCVPSQMLRLSALIETAGILAA